MPPFPSDDDYASEPVRYPQLPVLDVRAVFAHLGAETRFPDGPS